MSREQDFVSRATRLGKRLGWHFLSPEREITLPGLHRTALPPDRSITGYCLCDNMIYRNGQPFGVMRRITYNDDGTVTVRSS